MATKLTFNKPNGFMTVTSGHVPLFLWSKRIRIISKEEANSAFIAFRDIPTSIGQIGTLFLALMLLLPMDRPTTRSYEVKIVRASGKEVKLIESRKAELADYLAKRIVGFSTQSEVTHDIVNTQRMHQTEDSKIYAGFWRRLAAFIVDYLIVSAVMPIIGLTVEASTGVKMGQGAIIIFPPLHFIYCVGFWIWRGQTPGKMIVGIKIVNTNGYSIGIGRSILRYIGYIVSAIILYIGYFMIAWDSKKQGMHDMIASTYVIKTS